MTRLALIALLACASPGFAQEAASARGGVVRWLDKLSGQVGDLDIARGQSVKEGRLTIQLDDCRYPVADPASKCLRASDDPGRDAGGAGILGLDDRLEPGAERAGPSAL